MIEKYLLTITRNQKPVTEKKVSIRLIHMTEGEFRRTVERILGENNAVEEFSVGDRQAKATVHSRAGKKAKDGVIAEAVVEGYDAVYRGTDDGWEFYAVKQESPGELPEDLEEVRDMVHDYKTEASLHHDRYVSFGEWNRSE